jgi:uncharacterized membrane-anchored protein YjiN (DUF445 family)
MTNTIARKRNLQSDGGAPMTGPQRRRGLAQTGGRPAPDRARRMRITATLLLVLMAAVFIAGRQFEGVHPGVGYVVAFAEAAMVGGLADWFAVTALFRRPLGLPIPHTAIIPENKNRIADTMAGFLQDNFLTPHVVARRLRDMNLARSAGEFLVQPKSAGPGRIRAGAAGLLADLLESLDPERLGNQLRSGLARQAEKLEIAPLIGGVLSAAIADGRHRPVLDSLIRWAGLTLEANEELVRGVIHDRANALLRWTGLDERLANSVLDGLYRLLAEVLVDPNHPLRGKVEEGLQKLAHDLQHDPATRAKVEAAKNEVLGNPAVAAWWQGVWERLRKGLIATARNPNSSLGGQLGDSMAELGEALQRDVALQWQVNRFARRTLVGVASRYGSQIVTLVSETVKRWDARTVTGRIESAVGRDLQFIRINGTLVGGLVGVTIHALTEWL